MWIRTTQHQSAALPLSVFRLCVEKQESKKINSVMTMYAVGVTHHQANLTTRNKLEENLQAA
jgi:hypothetical protein